MTVERTVVLNTVLEIVNSRDTQLVQPENANKATFIMRMLCDNFAAEPEFAVGVLLYMSRDRKINIGNVSKGEAGKEVFKKFGRAMNDAKVLRTADNLILSEIAIHRQVPVERTKDAKAA